MAEKTYYGIYQGIVTNVTDPEMRGRIKVKCPDVLGGTTESAWCDPVVPVAYDCGGDFCLPQLDEAVWILFIGGDANRPVYLGGWWQKNQTPIGSNYTNLDDIRIISYADCIITMRCGVININVGAGVSDLSIADGHVTVNGSLTVNGDISAKNITSSGTVKGANVKTTTIDLNTHKHGGVTSGGEDTEKPK